jgi:hypothetical protein
MKDLKNITLEDLIDRLAKHCQEYIDLKKSLSFDKEVHACKQSLIEILNELDNRKRTSLTWSYRENFNNLRTA